MYAYVCMVYLYVHIYAYIQVTYCMHSCLSHCMSYICIGMHVSCEQYVYRVFTVPLCVHMVHTVYICTHIHSVYMHVTHKKYAHMVHDRCFVCMHVCMYSHGTWFVPVNIHMLYVQTCKCRVNILFACYMPWIHV